MMRAYNNRRSFDCGGQKPTASAQENRGTVPPLRETKRKVGERADNAALSDPRSAVFLSAAGQFHRPAESKDLRLHWRRALEIDPNHH